MNFQCVVAKHLVLDNYAKHYGFQLYQELIRRLGTINLTSWLYHMTKAKLTSPQQAVLVVGHSELSKNPL